MREIHSLSVGLSFIGTKDTDPNILAFAFAYEQQSQRRIEPHYLTNAEDIPAIAEAMEAKNY